MTKILMTAGCLLLKKYEPKKSEFEVTGSVDGTSPLYEVKHLSPGTALDRGDLVILKPGNYENIDVAGETYLYAEAEQIAGRVRLDG